VVPVLKGFDSLQEMQALANLAQLNALTNHLSFPFEQVTVLDQYHHGGYAKTSEELKEFIQTFNQTNQFPIEATYTGKALYALAEQAPNLNRAFQSILFVHTGGVV
jgi:1-aminocyclopropane-1-carboxylate deaminase